MSPELSLILSPRKTYAALVRQPVEVSAFRALRRPLLVVMVIGVSVSIAATGRATPALVASVTLTWSYIVALQLAIAMAVIARPARRTVGLARGVDLFFAGHAPWSLFVLATPVFSLLPDGTRGWGEPIGVAVCALATVRIVLAFGAEVLGFSRRDAWKMTIVHQGITWAVALTVIALSSSLMPRVLDLLGLA